MSGNVAFAWKVFSAIGVALLLAASVRWVFNVEIAPAKRERKRLDADLAEGVRLFNPKAGVDALRIGSCRIEKLRAGPIAFGGLNILAISNLTLNLPLPADDPSPVGRAGDGRRDDGRAVAEDLGMSDAILAMSGVKGRKFSGIRISGLQVNRIRGKSAVPLFAARSCRNKGRKLVMDGCELYSEETTNRVGSATLVFQPTPQLVWDGGILPLDDFIHDASP